MKIYSKLVGKIVKNKTRIKNAVGIVSFAIGLRYCKINSIPDNLSSNPTSQVERIYNHHVEADSGVLTSNKQISEGSKSSLNVRCGDLSKSGPGARAKADARQNAKAVKSSSGSTLIPGAEALVPQNSYCLYHKNAPLSCKSSVKVSNSPFQGDGDNNQPPPENDQFDSSSYKGGQSPFENYDYDNSDHTRENTDFSNKRRMSHSYDGHAKKCFGIQENRNKESLQKFEKNIRDYIESPETERINGSYRYETAAYHYKKPDEDLIVTVNATNNEYISARNVTDFQLEKLEIDGNLGYDSRPTMSLTLRLRGPKQ